MNGYIVRICSGGVIFSYDVCGENAMVAEENAIIEHKLSGRGEIDNSTPILVEMV